MKYIYFNRDYLFSAREEKFLIFVLNDSQYEQLKNLSNIYNKLTEMHNTIIHNSNFTHNLIRNKIIHKRNCITKKTQEKINRIAKDNKYQTKGTIYDLYRYFKNENAKDYEVSDHLITTYKNVVFDIYMDTFNLTESE